MGRVLIIEEKRLQMPRKATGQVIAPDGKQRSWALRFRAYGKRRYVTLGRPEDGWTRERAEVELRHVLADVERGIWRPAEPVAAPPEPKASPTFHEFASGWLANHEPELRPKTVASYQWQLTHHLLPHFASVEISAIGPAAVDAYKARQLREGRLGANQINKTLGTLARILEDAADYGLVYGRNPARGSRRRVRGTRPRPAVPDPEQLPALLGAAKRSFRPLLGTLVGAGLRNGEACALDWGDVNLASGTISVRSSKTDAGIRFVDVPLALREELGDHKARSAHAAPENPVFTNRNGDRQTVSNVERRLKTTIRHANVRLAALGLDPISAQATPHSLRHLYASLRFALRDDLPYVAEQGGWTDPAFALKVYARASRRRDRLTGEALRQFDLAIDWAAMGRIEPEEPSQDFGRLPADLAETPQRRPKLTPGPDSSAG